MTTPVTWPAALQPVDFGYTLVEADISGGQAIGGGEQFIASAGPRWEASMTLNVTNKDQVLALRALRVQLNGRVIPVKLPNFDGIRLSWPEQVAAGAPTGIILHPGNTRNRMLDGSIYESPAIPAASEINATVNASAAIRATTIVIAVTQGEEILPGQQFGIAGRLYEIGTSVLSIGSGPPFLYTVTFLPPLRAAVTAGTVVHFTDPTNLMRCLNLAEEFRRLQDLRFASLTLEFSEFL